MAAVGRRGVFVQSSISSPAVAGHVSEKGTIS